MKNKLIGEIKKVADELDRIGEFKCADIMDDITVKLAWRYGGKTLEELKNEAMESCEFRGHTMGAWHDYDETNSVSKCEKCGKEVQVLTNPAPNEIDIGGEAVALGCED